MPPISGQSILVLGGSSGIGFAVAQLCLESGARVAIASSNASKVEKAVERLKALSAEYPISGFQCDLSNVDDVESQLEGVLKKVTADGTKLDHIVSTAGSIAGIKSLAEVTAQDISAAGVTRFTAAVLIGKLSTKYLNQSYKSSLTFTSGQAAEKPFPGWSSIIGHATGQMGITKGLAVDLAPVRVNLVCPGAIKTEIWGDQQAQDAAEERYKTMTLLGKVGTPEEVAESYAYLMKDTNTTGTILHSNAGGLLKY